MLVADRRSDRVVPVWVRRRDAGRAGSSADHFACAGASACRLVGAAIAVTTTRAAAARRPRAVATRAARRALARGCARRVRIDRCVRRARRNSCRPTAPTPGWDRPLPRRCCATKIVTPAAATRWPARIPALRGARAGCRSDRRRPRSPRLAGRRIVRRRLRRGSDLGGDRAARRRARDRRCRRPDALATIADDEARHAALAWVIVDHCIARGGEPIVRCMLSTRLARCRGRPHADRRMSRAAECAAIHGAHPCRRGCRPRGHGRSSRASTAARKAWASRQ